MTGSHPHPWPARVPAAGLLVAGLVSHGCTSRPDVVAFERGTGGSWTAGAVGAGHAGVTTGAGNGGARNGVSAGAPGEGGARGPGTLVLGGDLDTHDSSVIEANGRYFLFRTGDKLPFKTSDDLLLWRDAGTVFSANPAWVSERVPEATGLWAPDARWFSGTYHLYYAASTFGSGWSCIGHATASDLGTAAWVDAGPVICSDVDGVDVDWDAIDPSAFVDVDSTPWLVFGSFGSGIKLIRLGADGARATDELFSLAARPAPPGAIQAPFLWRRAPYYYLFVSFDWCCRGVESTYNIRVGRSSTLLGPYVDRAGVPMLQGGGTLVLAGDDQWRGAGANTLVSTPAGEYNIYHSYDANAAGRATLRISEIAWDADGWPVSGGP